MTRIKKWITTWNDYLWRIKYFFRWIHNYKIAKDEGKDPPIPTDWITPLFVDIKKKKTKRVSPYLETELWDRDELMAIIKYEPQKRKQGCVIIILGFGCTSTRSYIDRLQIQYF